MAQHRRAPAEVDHKSKLEVLRIGLLGGFRVSVGAMTIEVDAWHLRKAAGLVKLLTLAPGHRLHREQVMDALWPDLAKRAASNNLRQTLHAARRTLDKAEGSRYLVSENEALILGQEGSLWVDVDTFEEAAIAARREKSPSAYVAAMELYTGELLPGDRKEAWTEGRRESLRRLYLALLLDLAMLHEDREEYERGIEVLRRLLAEDPAREETHADLMRLHARCGRRQEALLQYERLREILSREPGAETRRLYEEIRAGSFPAAPAPSDGREFDGEHNLPASSTSFVGREREIAEARRMLSMTRLLTLSGAGGSGKTRLAVEAVRRLAGAYPDGVWLAELAPLSEAGLVPQAVARALGVTEQPGRPLLGTLLEELRDKELLLVMDNCEHLIQASASLAETLLSSCPRLRILSTSREPLAVGGEALRQVGPLSLPETTNGGMPAEDLMGCEAVRLFVERARATVPDFGLTEGNAGAVVRVCRRLDGIPLAVELAAAQLGDLAVEQVAGRLEGSLDLLQSSRTVEPKQQTLRATLDWSHKLDLLEGLVDKSLVVAGAASEGAVRYSMLEPIRQYAREKLEESGEAEEARGRHGAFFLQVAEEAESELDGPQQKLWVEQLEEEHDNLRAALSWVLRRRETELGQRFGAALWRFWYSRGYLSEGRRWLERILADGDPAPERVRALEGMGWLAQHQGDIERAKAAYREMLELSRESGDRGNVATALNSLGTLAVSTGNNERAKRYLEENLSVLQQLEEEENAATTIKRYHAYNLLGILALNEDEDPARATALWKESLALARETGDSLRIGVSLCCLGYAAVLQGDNERATTLCEETLAFAREHEDAGEEVVTETLVNLGLAALGQGEYERAISSFDEALAMSRRAGRKASLINALEGMASLAGARGEAPLAARLWGAAEQAREVTGIALPPGDRALHESRLSSARSLLGEREWEEALAKGRAMSLEDAAGYVFSRDQAASPTSPAPQEPSADEPALNLSGREREVAVLVARGLTNRQISAQLGISERTAGNHVGRILGKLGFRSRAQIASWAPEHGLLTSNPD